MAPRRSHNAAVLFSIIALVFGILAILGTTAIPSIFVVEVIQAQTSQSIRYGFFQSCIYTHGVLDHCSASQVPYTIDIDQLVEINNVGVTSDLLEIIKNNVSQNPRLQVLRATTSIIPFAILTFLAMSLGIFMGHVQKDADPKKIWSFCGIATTLLACVFGTITLAVAMAVYQDVLDQLLSYVSLARYHWGPAVYLMLAASASIFFASLSFVASCFRLKRNEVASEKMYQLEFDPYEVYTPQPYSPEDDHPTYQHRY